MNLLYFYCSYIFILDVYCSLYNDGSENYGALVKSSSDNQGNMVKNEDGTNFYFNLFENEDDKNSEYGAVIEIIPGLNNIKQKYIKMIEGVEDDNVKEDLIRIMNMLISVKYNRLQDLGTVVHDNFFLMMTIRYRNMIM